MGTNNSALSRRSILGATLVGAGVMVGGPTLLTACTGSSSQGQANSAKDLSAVLPEFAEGSGGPVPDLPVVDGAQSAATDPGFLRYPTEMLTTVSEIPGKGGSYTTMTPLWGTIPSPGNAYYDAVNKALGADLKIQPADGNNYDKTIPTLVAADKLPDWIQMPTWWNTQPQRR